MSNSEQDFIREIEVRGKKYRLMLCSVIDQRKILMLFARYSLTRVLHALMIGDKDFLIASLFGELCEKATDEQIDWLSDTLLAEVYEKGQEEPITLDYFRNNMFVYMEMHAKALEANFGDFSDFLAINRAKAQETKPEARQ